MTTSQHLHLEALQKLRQEFNNKFFGTDFTDNDANLSLRTTKEDRRKSNYSFLDYQRLAENIEKYSVKDNKKKISPDSEVNRTFWYKASNMYRVENISTHVEGRNKDGENNNESGIKYKTTKVIVRKDNNKRLVAAPEIFDIIHENHIRVGHKKVLSTHNMISQTFCNVTHDQTKFFIERCPTCLVAKEEKSNGKKRKNDKMDSDCDEKIEEDILLAKDLIAKCATSSLKRNLENWIKESSAQINIESENVMEGTNSMAKRRK